MCDQDRKPVRDEDLEPGAYISCGPHLYEVLEPEGLSVWLKNCLTEAVLSTYRSSITGRTSSYELVKPAPRVEVPDTVPEELVAASSRPSGASA